MNRVWSQETYQKALLFAAAAHKEQKMPGGELPYAVHFTLVAMEVIAALRAEPGLREDFAIQCALLHDVIEDTSTTANQLLEVFGKNVTDGVMALTKNKDLPSTAKMADSLSRIVANSQEVMMVKMADRIVNLQVPPRHWNEDKKRAYLDEAMVIFQALHKASPFLASRMEAKMKEYPRYF